MKTQKLISRLAIVVDDIRTKYRFYLLYLIGAVISLLVTDTLVTYNTYTHDRSMHKMEMENIAKNAMNLFTAETDTASTFAANICKNSYIQDYIANEYPTALDYVIKNQEFKERTLLATTASISGFPYIIYVNNPTVLNGGFFQRIEKAHKESWFSQYVYSEESPLLYFDFDKGNSSYSAKKRHFLILRDMDSYRRDKSQKILKVEINYSLLYQKMLDMNFSLPVYILSNGNEVISNTADSDPGKPYQRFNASKENCYILDFPVFGTHLSVCVKDVSKPLSRTFSNHAVMFFVLGLLNFISIVIIIMFLIHSVYKTKIREQEMIVARQNAELLALRGQINPHFLFNMLESIRMHSVIKEENETAQMIQSLAHIQRQYVDWGADRVTVAQELECAKAYLELQKYRFGDRLNYKIEADEECSKIFIPKLSIVTFVENSCVHGIENKSTPCWIFVRALKVNDMMEIEVEDSGMGMSEQKKNELIQSINEASISLLKEKGRVGIINACLRLKIATDNKVQFIIDSEEMVGTCFTLRIPLDNGRTGIL